MWKENKRNRVQITSDFTQQVYDLMTGFKSGNEGVDTNVKKYIKEHLLRFVRTLQAIPHNSGDKKLLDVAALANLVPCYQKLLGYNHITITSKDKNSHYFVPSDLKDRLKKSEGVRAVFFDAEFEKFPFPDETFDVVVCLEVIEHLTMDPMALMSELNRVCAFGGTIIMSTPNVLSWRSLGKLVAGEHPSVWAYYGGVADLDRHNREYTPKEMEQLIYDAGFDRKELVTFNIGLLQTAHKWLRWCLLPLKRFWDLPGDSLRGDFILVSGRKQSKVRNRLPDWLYGGYKEDRQILAKAGKYNEPI